MMFFYLAIRLLRSGLLSPLNTFMSWFEIGFVIFFSLACWLFTPTHNKMTDTDARLLLLATLMQHSLTLLMRLGHLLLVTHAGVLKQ